MRLTYEEARDDFATTDLGYKMRDLDKIWFVFMFDTDSTDQFRHNPLHPRGNPGSGWSYDLFDTEPVFTTYREAEAFAQDWRAFFARRSPGDEEPPTIHVCNLGDWTRYENRTLGDTRVRETPLFKNSAAALAERSRQHVLARKHLATLGPEDYS